MASCSDVVLHIGSTFWILSFLLCESVSKKTQILYMEGNDCGSGRSVLGGATVYSHRAVSERKKYEDNNGCMITFEAEKEDMKIMMRVMELDIPDRTMSALCNDALYVYDSSTIGRAFDAAGGNGGLCGSEIPPAIYTSGRYLTLYFRTDKSGPKGKGFKLIVTAYRENQEECEFRCSNKMCIDKDLKCDEVDHCGDHSDEELYTGGNCKKAVSEEPDKEPSVFSRLLSLGITASIFIVVGSIVLVVVCVVCIVCCCCRVMQKRDQDPGGRSTTSSPPAAATGAVNSNSHAPPIPPQPHPQMAYNPAYAQQGYYPMPHKMSPPPGVHGITYSQYPSVHRESYSQGTGSAYSSQPPPSYHRSYTPTSSRSGKSNKSTESSVKFSSNHEKVALPVHV